MGINAINNVSTQQLTTTVSTHSDGVTGGDFLYYTDGGSAWPTSRTALINQINVSTAGVSSLRAYTNALISGTYGCPEFTSETIVELGNGIIAYAYTGNGTANNTGVNVAYFTQEITAYTAQATTVVVTTASITAVKIAKLTSTTFVVAWATTSGTNSYNFRIYNNDGTAVTAATLISNIGNGTPVDVNMQVLGNGDIVFVYQKVTTGANTFSRYNSSGVLQGSETTVGTGTNLSYVAILSHSSGDFWIYYLATGWRFSRYNSSGVLQGSETVIRTSGTTGASITTNYLSNIKELSNGNVLMWATIVTQNTPIPYVYTSAGVLVATGVAPLSNNGVRLAPEIIVESGYFYATGYAISPISNTSNYQVVKYTNALVAEFSVDVTNPNTVNNASGGVGTYRFFRDGGNFYAYYATRNATTSAAGVIAYDSNFLDVGARISLYSVGNTVVSGSTCLFTSKGYLIISGQAGIGSTGYAVINPCRRSMIGVAANTAAPGANVVIQTVGTYPINNPPVNPGTYDTRTATPAGSKGLIVGTSAILYGTT